MVTSYVSGMFSQEYLSWEALPVILLYSHSKFITQQCLHSLGLIPPEGRTDLSVKPNVKSTCMLLATTPKLIVTEKGELWWHPNGLNDSFSKSTLEKIKKNKQSASRCH